MNTSRPSIYRFRRIVDIIREKDYVSLKDIANDMEVSERTILRDLNCLRYEMRVPVEFDKYKKQWHLSENDFELPPLSLTDEDYKALRVGFDILKFITPHPNERVIRRAIEVLGYIVQKNFPSHEISFLSAGNDGHFISDNDDLAFVFQETEEAIVHKLKAKIKYYSPYNDETSKRIIYPLHLHNHGGSWFLLGYDEAKKDFRLFALKRIIKFDIIQEKFEFPEEFKKDSGSEDYIKRCFTRQLGELQKVKVKFDSYQSRWIKDQSWFKDQKVKKLKSGEIILEFEVSELDQLKRWIMQYGSNAEVLEPKEFKNLIKEELKKMMKIYK